MTNRQLRPIETDPDRIRWLIEHDHDCNAFRLRRVLPLLARLTGRKVVFRYWDVTRQRHHIYLGDGS